MANDYGSMARYYDILYPKVDDIQFYKEYVEHVQSPVLELASGTGRLLVPIAQWGKEVYGLEIDPSITNVAKEKIAKEKEEVQHRIHIFGGDMRTFSLDMNFNLIISAFSVLREITTADERRQVIASAYNNLSTSGILIIDNNNGIRRKGEKAVLEFNGSFKDEATAETITAFEVHKWNEELKKNEHHIFIDRSKKDGSLRRENYYLELNYIPPEETLSQLKNIGFRRIDVYSDYSKSPFDWGNILNNKRQIFVAKRKE